MPQNPLTGSVGPQNPGQMLQDLIKQRSMLQGLMHKQQMHDQRMRHTEQMHQSKMNQGILGQGPSPQLMQMLMNRSQNPTGF